MIGYWNKSVILTYLGIAVSVIGIVLSFSADKGVKYAMICLMVAGVCDLFDGVVARRCKRTNEEKEFGIQLDSLADVVNFTALPIAIFASIGLNKLRYLPILSIYAVFSIARLAFFNLSAQSDSPVKYYRGLPVTFSALIFPVFYLFSFLIKGTALSIFFSCVVLAVSVLYVVDFKMPKPKGKAYIVFSLVAVVMLLIYIFAV
ncbi:MAG: CDP-alcohol phosphatidyltransferase family protein [Clostridia bacterium]|nr:CDP-alcohol phosphatidyltransferase family protein [Clostridia bacterium]